MGSVNDVGVPGQPLSTPPLTVWQKAVRDALNSKDTTVDARITSAVAAGAPWQQWTPTTNGAVYSAVTAWWSKASVVNVVVKCIVTSVSGDISFSAPTQIHADAVGSGVGTFRCVGNSAHHGHVYASGSSTLALRIAGANGLTTQISPTVPMTWKAGDQIYFTAWYPTP